MVIVIHKSGRSWDDSACDDNVDIKNVAARWTIQFAMVFVIHKRCRPWDVSASDDNRNVKRKYSWNDSIRDGCRDS